MEPAKSIIDKLGGPTEVARITGVHRTVPYKWMKTGAIPRWHVSALLDEAKARRVKLRADDFLPSAAA